MNNINEQKQNEPKMSLNDYKKLIESNNADLIKESINQEKSPLLSNWEASDFYKNIALNPKGQNLYKGLNVLVLDTKKAVSGFDSNQWLTFKQATELGAQIIKGSKSVGIVFTQKKKTDDEIEKIKAEKSLLGESLTDKEVENLKKNLIKYYPVFNVAQIDFKENQRPQFMPEYKPKKVDMDLLEKISKKYESNLSLEYKVLRNQIAKYIVSKDFGDSYKISSEQKDLLMLAAKNLDSETFKQALSDGSKMSFDFFKEVKNTHKSEIQEEQKPQEKTEAKEAMQYFRDNKIVEEVPQNNNNYENAVNKMFDSNNVEHTRRVQRQ